MPNLPGDTFHIVNMCLCYLRHRCATAIFCIPAAGLARLHFGPSMGGPAELARRLGDLARQPERLLHESADLPLVAANLVHDQPVRRFVQRREKGVAERAD